MAENTPTGSRADRNDAQTPARTPSGRATSEATSIRHLAHTPLDRTANRDLLNSVRRGTSGRRSNAPTPHAKAARQALTQRRTALFTPGKLRRRSLMEQRETPMGILRDLSKMLKPTTQRVAASSSSSPYRRESSAAPTQEEGDDDDDDELMIDRPRLSLPIDEEEYDSDLQPPRLSGLEDITVRSVELPRRVDVERDNARLSRASLGSVAYGEPFNDADQTGEINQPSSFFDGGLGDFNNVGGDLVEDQASPGSESDFGLELPPDIGDGTTYILSAPGSEQAPTSPLIETEVREATAHDQQDVAEPPLFDVGFDSDENVPFEDMPASPEADPTQDATFDIQRKPRPKRKSKRISRHGIEYPALPPAFVKRVAQTSLQSSGLSNSTISADTLTALTQASEWFFEQLGDDLGAYAEHAKRKTIEDSDVATLMRRQRQIGSTATMFSLAQRHLPRELLQELRMPLPHLTKRRKTAGAAQKD